MKTIYLGSMELLLSTFLCLGFFNANASDHHPEDHFSHLPQGGRKGLHGMVLFGSGPYFLEHIPMLTPPHDFQIITEILLKNEKGLDIKSDFSRQGFTLQPSSSFSLNDFIAGRLKNFTASIHRGSFEKDGPIEAGLEKVSVEIQTYKIIRQLPGLSQENVLTLKDGKNVFESDVIRPGNSIQRIRNLTTGEILWCVKAPDFFESCQ